MKNSDFEYVDHVQGFPGKVFVTSINTSKYHWHYDYEILILLQGELQVSGKSFNRLYKAGDVLLLNSETIHEYRSTSSKNICIIIQFPKELFSHMLLQDEKYYFYLDTLNPVYTPKKGAGELIKLASRLAYFSRHREGSAEFHANGAFYSLMAYLLEHVEHDLQYMPTKKTQQNATSMELAVQINEYLAANSTDSQLQQSVLNKFGITERTLHRILKNTFGFTLKELIDKARLDRAKVLLKTTDFSILEIAETCGFVSEATFYRLFRKELKVTPKEYRQGQEKPSENSRIKDYLNYNGSVADRLLRQYGKI